MTGELGIVQFVAHYYPKGYNVCKEFSIKLTDIKTKADMAETLYNSDLQYIHFPDGEGLGWYEKLEKAVSMNGNVKHSFIAFVISGYAGFGNDCDYTSGVQYSLDMEEDADMEHFVEDAYADFYKLFEDHPVLSKSYSNFNIIKEHLPLKECDNVLSINVPTLWRYSGGYDSYFQEYDFEIEWLGIVDMKKIEDSLVKE